MASYTLNTTTHQEDVAAFCIRRRQAQATREGRVYDGPTTTGQLLIEMVTTGYVNWNNQYEKQLAAFYVDELSKAAATDTKASIIARAEARMIAAT